mmetsp:Transcript_3094/g.6464  ORF Transcript_3094/g.6464 Transcript_3094/m.6464 type:complete len:226 (+) Transcript_3094:43-720(+)
MAAAEGGAETVPLPVRKLNGEVICQIHADPSAPVEELKREVHTATCIPVGFFSLLKSEDGLTIVLESDRPWDKLFVDACTFGDVPLIQSTLPLLPSTLCEEKQGLLLAILKKWTRVVELLLEKGVSANLEMNDVGLRPLHLCARTGDAETLRVLLRGKADVDAANEDGDRALHFAACRKDSDFVSLLLDARADPAAKNCMGETAMDNAWNEDVRGIFDLKWSNDD